MKNQNALTTMTAATVISGKSTFEPRAVRKRQKDIYRFETSEGFISCLLVKPFLGLTSRTAL